MQYSEWARVQFVSEPAVQVYPELVEPLLAWPARGLVLLVPVSRVQVLNPWAAQQRYAVPVGLVPAWLIQLQVRHVLAVLWPQQAACDQHP